MKIEISDLNNEGINEDGLCRSPSKANANAVGEQLEVVEIEGPDPVQNAKAMQTKLCS